MGPYLLVTARIRQYFRFEGLTSLMSRSLEKFGVQRSGEWVRIVLRTMMMIIIAVRSCIVQLSVLIIDYCSSQYHERHHDDC